MAWQGNGMGTAWARHAMCESAFMFRMCLHSEWQHIHDLRGSNSTKVNGHRGSPQTH